MDLEELLKAAEARKAELLASNAELAGQCSHLGSRIADMERQKAEQDREMVELRESIEKKLPSQDQFRRLAALAS